jgi:hypothetical protein
MFELKWLCVFLQSLKKEVDWGDRSSAGDDKSITGEGSSEYRSPIDPVSCPHSFYTLFSFCYFQSDSQKSFLIFNFFFECMLSMFVRVICFLAKITNQICKLN